MLFVLLSLSLVELAEDKSIRILSLLSLNESVSKRELTYIYTSTKKGDERLPKLFAKLIA